MFHIHHDLAPAQLVAEKAEVVLLRDGLAVAEVILTDGDDAVLRKEAHEIVVPFDVLCNAVHYLHHGARRAVWYALARVYRVHCCA